MMKSKLGLVIAVLCVFTMVFGACGDSTDQKTTTTSEQGMTAKAVQIQSRASSGEYIDVVFEVSGDQPCKLVLAKRQAPEFDNYLYPNSSAPLAYPDSDGNIVFHELVPQNTTSGSYILKLVQVTPDGEELEIYRQSGFIVQYQEFPN